MGDVLKSVLFYTNPKLKAIERNQKSIFLSTKIKKNNETAK